MHGDKNSAGNISGIPRVVSELLDRLIAFTILRRV